MITITRDDRTGNWVCVIDLRNTPAAAYAPFGLGADSPHARGDGKGPHAALDNALLLLGLETIKNPTDAGR